MSRTSSSLKNPYRTLHKANKAPTKRLKRESKHVTLLSRISKSAPAPKVAKRRRPSKKLMTDLEDLVDALPDASAASRNAQEAVGGDERANIKIRHQSLKSRPGAGKKKQKLVAMETERFRKNMARMAAGSAGTGRADSTANLGGKDNLEDISGRSAERWAAIRGFISQTMERRPDGVAVKGKG